ncbi:aspartate/glutamate racemase family protein [Temperatibacter marinus]|uniref:Aspartate/glutamate racemase family protein n=1 Tax=Temperatibacter marinus TaxID=1456591 RepID=A0AA52H8F8_9PROT|nr:aspartate/glutamate racemase family protein [Temperatibacter marinus]WND01402.1 aspartate/glutamate racemase family protein [Temperatibacter marinus]
MKTLGLIGGMSWESTQVYYKLLNEMIRSERGGLHSASLLLHSFDFAEIEAYQAQGDWRAATTALCEAAVGLKKAGAECIVICTNTMHKMALEVEKASGLPVLHIADATARAIQKKALKKPLLLATDYTMKQDFYKGRLRDLHQIHVVIPNDDDCQKVHDIIYEELCQGIVSQQSKETYIDIIKSYQQQGCDGVILGCTEIGLLIHPSDVTLPLLNTTILHCREAVQFALN